MDGTQESLMLDDAQNAKVSIGIGQEKKKICPRCWVEKPLSDFHANRNKKDGHVVYCKICCSKEHQVIYIENKDQILKNNKIWHDNNKEHHAELTKRWYNEHPEKIRESSRKSVAKWRKTPEGAIKSKEWSKEWRKNNPERTKELMKNYYKNNKEKCDEVKRKADVARLYGLDVIDYYLMIEKQNNQCYICGKPPKKNSLAVDHDHKTGKVRKLLCHGCNHEIGVIEKGEESLIKLLKYLAEHENEMAISILMKLIKNNP